MSDKTHLYHLWTNANPITAVKMVSMYAINAMKYGWWEKVTLLIWGTTGKLVNDDDHIRGRIQEAQEAGVILLPAKPALTH